MRHLPVQVNWVAWVWRWCLLLTFCCARLHAAPAFEDSIAQRTLACTGCHGAQGRAAPDGYYPRIAGKPAGYLLNQLRNFREGRRHYALMAGLVDPLSEAYLLEIASYFSALALPYPPPPPVALADAEKKRGEALVSKGDTTRRIPACMTCHGQQLTGVAPHVPGLLGLPRDYVNAQLGAWKTGQRRAHAPDCMAHIARQLDTEDVAAITGWLAAQPLPVDTRPASGVPVRAVPALVCGSAPELGGTVP